jgi:hypothetical protein
MFSLMCFTLYYKITKRNRKVNINLLCIIVPLIVDYLLIRDIIINFS